MKPKEWKIHEKKNYLIKNVETKTGTEETVRRKDLNIEWMTDRIGG